MVLKVDKAICNAYHWVAVNHPICLYPDNTEGHITLDIVDKYIKEPADKYIVICIHQLLHSPTINMLHLGVWVALQSVLKKFSGSARR